ncbi:MAG: HU family DNA-binding protein [Candidatus Berkelbacteria bacterium]|nr:HU family DNA-binding protein [Candidatus Berkelbacteria bacterium]
MTKLQLAANLSKEMKAQGIKFNRDKAEDFIDAITNSIDEILAKDRGILVSNFGKFKIFRTSSKIITSPRGDGKKFFMPPTDIIRWHPAPQTRIKGGSEEVSDDDWQKMKTDIAAKKFDFGPDLVATATNLTSEKPPRKNPNEVNIVVNNFGQANYFDDDSSPLCRFARRVFQLMEKLCAKKFQIIPHKQYSLIIFSTGGNEISEQKIPIVSHQIISQKIETLAKTRGDNVSQILTPQGKTLVVEKV